ncbi:carbonic anhydrase, partial [Nocardia farcinica]|uniref:carbonic anhydrase n=1 Tax=Nocardia farcinica TaxID=37329 RepID=UPI00263B5EA6
LHELRDGQSPHSLFLACSDSRLVPNVITGSGPGDLFTVRNIGNIVAPDALDTSLEAALAFGIDTVGVSAVVVCGHSGCGAMQAIAK